MIRQFHRCRGLHRLAGTALALGVAALPARAQEGAQTDIGTLDKEIS